MSVRHVGTKTIETERLILRRFVLEDAQAMFTNWASDADVCKYLSWEPYEDVDSLRKMLQVFIDAYEHDDNYHWVIELKEIGEPIGSISAIQIHDAHLRCELGYCMGKPFWSKGYMTEAAEAVIRFFFEEVGLNRIQAHHDVQNVGSGKVMQKAGMTLEGTLRQRYLRRDGAFGDGRIYAIVREDYETIE